MDGTDKENHKGTQEVLKSTKGSEQLWITRDDALRDLNLVTKVKKVLFDNCRVKRRIKKERIVLVEVKEGKLIGRSKDLQKAILERDIILDQLETGTRLLPTRACKFFKGERVHHLFDGVLARHDIFIVDVASHTENYQLILLEELTNFLLISTFLTWWEP